MNFFILLYLSSCSVYDMRKGEIPSCLLYLGTAISTVFVVYKIQKMEMIIVYILYSSLPAMLCIFFSLLKLGIGEADAYIIYSLGIVYGLYFTVFILSISAVEVFLYLTAFRMKRNVPVPFVPFLFLSTLIFLYLRQ